MCGKRNLNRTRNFQKHKDATKECIFYWEKCYLQLSLIKLTENIGFRGKRERYVHERAMIIALKVATKEAFRFETRKRSVVFKGAGFRFSKGFHNRRKQTWGILMELVNNKLNERKCTLDISSRRSPTAAPIFSQRILRHFQMKRLIK